MERSWQCHGLFHRFFHGFFHRTGVVFTANSHPAPNMDGTSLKRVAEETMIQSCQTSTTINARMGGIAGTQTQHSLNLAAIRGWT